MESCFVCWPVEESTLKCVLLEGPDALENFSKKYFHPTDTSNDSFRYFRAQVLCVSKYNNDIRKQLANEYMEIEYYAMVNYPKVDRVNLIFGK